nr:hypothetical protein [Tanacetum cinerariifolium]GEZ62451.1 hypothetical protein [Tanacetum cinerariifolium]
MLRVLGTVIYEPLILTPVQESPLKATITTLPPLSVSTTPSLRVAKLEKDVYELKKIDLFTEALAALMTQVGDVFQKELKKHTANLIQKYSLQQIHELSKKQTPTVNLEQESKKTPSEIIKIKKEQADKQKMPKFTIKSTDKATLKEYDQKSALYQTIHANKSFNINLANHRLYHALMEALIEDENAIDKGVVDTVQDHKRKHDDDEDDDEDPPVGPNQGKKIKRRRTKELESSKKPSTTKEIPRGKASSNGSKTSKLASAKEPFDKPIAKVVMDDAGDDVVHDDDQPQDASEPKTDKTLNPYWPDWNNPEEDRYPFALSKPFPLQGHLGHLTVVANYFINNDLEYLKSFDLKKTYIMSITKTKAAGYEIEGIEYMVLTLWSPTKEAYD